MQNLQLKGKGQYKQGTLNVDVPVMLFKDSDTWYAYLPSFDLTGYGGDPEEAKESLKVVLNEFIRYTLNKKTFFEELKRLGWKFRPKSKRLKAPEMSELIEENKELKEIVNTREYYSARYPVNIPAFA